MYSKENTKSMDIKINEKVSTSHYLRKTNPNFNIFNFPNNIIHNNFLLPPIFYYYDKFYKSTNISEEK